MWPFLQTPNTSCGCEQSGTNQCGCDKISSLDVSYNGPALVCSGIELCDSLTVALQKIEEKICTAGNISGSGINNYVARWNPNGNTLSTGLIRDDGVSTAINTAPNPDVLLRTHTFLHGYANYTSLSRVSNENNIGIKSLTLSSTDTNIGIQGIGSGKDNNINIGINGIGTGISDDAGTAITIGGKFEAYDTSFGNSYAVQLYDGSQGVGKFLKSITNDGHANWANITTADITGFPSSVVGGSGIQDYVARWTNSTTLGTGVIRDDNTSVGINTVPDTETRLSVEGGSLRGIYASTIRVSTPSDVATGTYSTSYGVGSSGENIGVLGTASNNTNVNYGVYGGCSNSTTGKNIGLRGVASNGAAGNYAIQLADGTQAAGKFLKSITNNGEANWANITSSDTTGATGTFTSQDGKTITVTNGLITSII